VGEEEKDSVQEPEIPEEGLPLELDEEQIPGLIPAEKTLPETLVIIPQLQRPVYPGLMFPLLVPPGRLVGSISYAAENNHQAIGLLSLQKDDPPKELREIDFYRVGTSARMLKVAPGPDGGMNVLINTYQRFRIEKFLRLKPHILVKVQYLKEEYDKQDKELKALSIAIMGQIKLLSRDNPLFGEELRALIGRVNTDDPARLADLAISLTNASKEELQKGLETLDVRWRMELALTLLIKDVELVQLQQKIHRQIEEKITKQQRDFFLREQLKAIKQELGLEQDQKQAEISRFQDLVKKTKFSEEGKKRAEEELDKLSLTDMSSPEFNVSRNYLDWLVSLPWGKFSKEILDIKKARKILDEDHYGLDDVKQRIVEFIAVRKQKKNTKGSILCFVGPPGVGKTSIGRSVARALNRKFYRFSLGGMRDEAEIKGHRRTYIGAMPGKLIHAMKAAGTANPVIMLDEIDKVGASYQGDPSSALLEVLDPEQNYNFQDYYLDVHFDLSNVLFIATANVLDTIPLPLLDRMEVLRLSGYTTQEKVEIAQRHLVPKQMKEHGLLKKDLTITKEALREIINGYAREAGVRNLEKEIAHIYRKMITEKAEGKKPPKKIVPKTLVRYLGRVRFEKELIEKKLPPGVVMGMAWTMLGGAIMYIESITASTGKDGFKQTGQLGNVMVESSTIAYSYVQSKAKKYGIKGDFFKKNFIHLHVPAGATPKDGPSAGAAMATSLLSLALGKSVDPFTAMTGELTLTGRILPVGGIREKVLAAKRAGAKRILLPKENEKDHSELADYIKKGLTFKLVDHMNQVKKLLFEDGKSVRSKKSK